MIQSHSKGSTQYTSPAVESVRSISFYDTTLEQYASKELKRVTIWQMIEFCQGKVTPEKLLLSARYVHDELPKRLARRLMDLRTLPYIIITNPYVKRVYEIYVQAFDRIRNFPKIESLEEEARFTLLLKEIVSETTQVVDLLAKGTSEATKKVPRSRLNLDSFLENMLLSRIGRRVLAEQHVLYHKPRDSGYIGVINPRCNIASCVKAAVNQASSVCHNTYGSVPTVEFKGSLAATIPYIPAHLEFVCFEILKNSMRAVVEQKIKDGSLLTQSNDTLPEVEILIAEGPEQTTVRISDRGGGLSPESAAEAFQFGFTTAIMNDPGTGFGNQFLMLNDHSPMAGLGFGLPLARLYTRHFGGDLELVSMYGYGTDVYIRLDRTGDQVEKVEI
jgi:signal transduction histidine kinase